MSKEPSEYISRMIFFFKKKVLDRREKTRELFGDKRVMQRQEGYVDTGVLCDEVLHGDRKVICRWEGITERK
jgi:hypothetical protein